MGREMNWQEQPRRRVMGAIRTRVGALTFDSRREARRYQELLLLERAREISDLHLQVEIQLQGQKGPILTETGKVMTYRADFRYFDHRTMQTVHEDAKGHPTDVFKMKRAILKAMGVEIVTV